MYDLTGKNVYPRNTEGIFSLEVNTSPLPRGSYLIKVYYHDATTATGKVLITH